MILQPNYVRYSRYSIIASLLFSMMYMLGIWFNEYHGQLNLISQVGNLRQDIYREAYQFQDKVREHEKLLQERAVLERRVQEVHQSRVQRSDPNKPVTRPLITIEPAPSTPPPPSPRVEDTNIPSKIHLLGVLELELSESTSWHTLIKMIVTVLTTFFGIKLINLAFRRWEKPVAG